MTGRSTDRPRGSTTRGERADSPDWSRDRLGRRAPARFPGNLGGEVPGRHPINDGLMELAVRPAGPDVGGRRLRPDLEPEVRSRVCRQAPLDAVPEDAPERPLQVVNVGD